MEEVAPAPWPSAPRGVAIGALDRAVTSELGDSQWPPRAELGTEVGAGGHGVGREGGTGRA